MLAACKLLAPHGRAAQSHLADTCQTGRAGRSPPLGRQFGVDLPPIKKQRLEWCVSVSPCSERLQTLHGAVSSAIIRTAVIQ